MGVPAQNDVQVGLVPRLAHEMMAAALTSNLRYLTQLGVNILPIKKHIGAYAEKQFNQHNLPTEDKFYPMLDRSNPDAIEGLRGMLQIVAHRFSLISAARSGMKNGLLYTKTLDQFTSVATSLTAHFPELLEIGLDRTVASLKVAAILYEGEDESLAIVNISDSSEATLYVLPPCLTQPDANGAAARDLPVAFLTKSGSPLGNEFVKALCTAPAPTIELNTPHPLDELWRCGGAAEEICSDAYGRLIQLGHDLLEHIPAFRASMSEFGEVDLILLKAVQGVIVSNTWDEVVEQLIGHSFTKGSADEARAGLAHNRIQVDLTNKTFWRLREVRDAPLLSEEDKTTPSNINPQKDLERDWLSFFGQYFPKSNPTLPKLESFLKRNGTGLEWDKQGGKGSHTRIHYQDPQTGSRNSTTWAVPHHNGHMDSSSPDNVRFLARNLASIGAKVPWQLLKN
jgi:hypothetical protein